MNTTEINNVQIIKTLLSFESADVFYHLQVMKRKKENPELGSNNVIIKTYYISSLEYLDMKMAEIISLCKIHNARAYINLNRRSFEKMAFHLLKKVTDQIMCKDFKSARNAYESVCGAYSCATDDKKWIIDIDDSFEPSPLMLAFIDFKCDPISTTPIDGKIYASVPTKNGVHLITKPFNLKTFKEEYPDIDVHKNNPTLIYMNCK